ncbi:MAG: hypothetical protein ACRD2X_23920 [Vicinamibacteraceae bacterium]
MMAIWLTLGFICGGLCGVLGGVLVMSLLVAAKGQPNADIPGRPQGAASV